MGGHTILPLDPPPLDPPKSVFRLIDHRLHNDVGDKQSEAYGFNGGDEWEMPDTYIRWVQPMESDLAKQCEYDMDEQDQEWLSSVNAERAKRATDAVSYEFFEIIMDRLEKEWFDLSRQFPKDDHGLVPSEDSKCSICEDGDTENSNAIVFCDGCNLAVHQDCYGVPYIPEGQWLCRKCTVSPDKPVSCILCPNSYGAFKQTTENQWAHLICAIHVPETGVSNAMYMEPIDGVRGIPKPRWKLKCYICKKPRGACIQCSKTNCFTAYHVTCAQDNGLYIKLKAHSSHFDGPNETRSFCDKHTPREHFEALQVAAEARAAADALLASNRGESPRPLPPAPRKQDPLLQLRHLRSLATGSHSSKSARAYRKTYASSGPPVVPAYIYNRVLEYTARLRTMHKKVLISMICRYWSLKREGRRGAPLLKRLHLEPWTAAASNKQQTEEDRFHKLSLLGRVRNDLEKVRMLAELTRKRERAKLQRAQLQKEVVESFLFPHAARMRRVLRAVADSDKSSFFLYPVNRQEVPDYYDVIKEPMDWSTIEQKIERQEYFRPSDFVADVRLVLKNATTYNRHDTSFHKIALKIARLAEPALTELEDLDAIEGPAAEELEEIERLFSLDAVDELMDFEYEPEPPAPLPPPPAPKEHKSSKKKKDRGSRDSAPGTPATLGNLAKRGSLGQRELHNLLDSSPGFGASASASAARRGPSVRHQRGNQLLPSDPTDFEETVPDRPRSSTTPYVAPRRTRGLAAAEKALMPDGSEPEPDAPVQGQAGQQPIRPALTAAEQEARDLKNRLRREEAAAKRAAKEEQARKRRESGARKAAHLASDSAPPVSLQQADDAAAKKRIGVVLPTKPVFLEAPPDERQALYLFNAGFILPEGSSRRGTSKPSGIPPPSGETRKTIGLPRKREAKVVASSSSAPMEVDSAAPADLDDNSSALSDLTALPDETEGEGLSPRRSFKRYGKRGPKGKFTREVNEIAPEAEAPGRVSGSAEMVAEQAANVDATGVEVVDAAADTTMDGLETPRVSRRARNDVGPAEQPMLAEGNDPGTGGRRTRGTKRNADALEEDEKAGPALPEGPYIIVGPRRGPAPPRPKVPTGKAELLPRDDRGFRIFPKVKGKAGKQRIDPVTQEAWEEMRSATHLPEGRVADGTLVWAKMAGHPWFPAETSILDKNVPPAVAQMKPANAAAYVLVMFFDGDDRRTWQWLRREFVRLLGENKEMDALLQSEAFEGSDQKRAKVSAAYRVALTSMETDAEEEGVAVAAAEVAEASSSPAKRRR